MLPQDKTSVEARVKRFVVTANAAGINSFVLLLTAVTAVDGAGYCTYWCNGQK
jgi:hypothetical protein